MDASPMPPEFFRELEALRRRAYGLDADIDADPMAQQRLTELEAALHSAIASPASASACASPAPATVSVPAASPSSVPPMSPLDGRAVGARTLVAADEPDELFDPVRHDSAPLISERRSWSLRGVATVLTAVVALGWAASALSSPRGDDVLPGTPSTAQERQDLVDHVDLESVGMVGARLQQFGEFRGLSVWSAVNRNGETCLMVGAEGDRDFQVGCTPSPLRPALDLHVGDQIRPELVGDLPIGSVIRFVLHGDDVGVWIAKAVALSR